MKIGILGGGQLAQMMALAGIPLGIDCIVLDSNKTACAGKCAEHICAPYTDEAALQALIKKCDVITFDAESIPLEAATKTRCLPGAQSLKQTQDRLLEKQLCQANTLSTAPYFAVETPEDIQKALQALGAPLLLKSRKGGYDGRGQQKIDAHSTVHECSDSIVEALVPFDREVSIIGVRNRSGQILFYDLVENVHREGILHTSRNRRCDPMQKNAEKVAQTLMEALDHVGVFTVELFDVNGSLIVNEIAPRVHNSGHWTIEGAQTSQFENHLRAIGDLPLGSCESIGECVMTNIIGKAPDRSAALADQTHLHLYGKEPRPKRKIGHLNKIIKYSLTQSTQTHRVPPPSEEDHHAATRKHKLHSLQGSC